MQRLQTFRTFFAAACAVVAASLMLASCNSGSQPVQPLSITSGSPPNGVVGAAYNFNLVATGGEGSYSWSWHASPGSTLPPGLSVSMCLVLTPPGQGCSQPQTITGKPTTAGAYQVVVEIQSFGSQPQSATATYTITIAP